MDDFDHRILEKDFVLFKPVDNRLRVIEGINSTDEFDPL